MALPEEHRRKPDQYRYILRQAMRGILPEIVRTRPDKGEFSHVLAKASQTLGNRFSLDSMAIASLGWVKPDTIRSRYQRMVLRYEADDPGYTEGIWNLWMVFGIEAWFRVVSMNGGA
jgi:asparagine synthase (glutamine-hydrolysing)